MDKQCVNTSQELNCMQSRIASLFQEIIDERNQYRLNYNNLKEKLEKVSSEVQDLTRKNEAMKQTNEELRKIIFQCFKLFGSMDFSSFYLSENYKSAIETIKKTFLQTDKNAKGIPKLERSKSSNDVPTGFKFNDEDIKEEIDSVKELNFSTQFDEEDEKTLARNELIFNRSESSSVLQKLFDRKQSEKHPELKVPLLVGETEGFDSQLVNTADNSSVCETVQILTQQEVTPKKEWAVDMSPVFKDFANRRQDSLCAEENNAASKPTAVKLNEKFLLKSGNLFPSPLKRPSTEVNSSSRKREPSTPKRSRTKLNVNSPGRQLKKSNSREAEISTSGIRKLTQTVLNVESFRKKSPEGRKNLGNIENRESTSVDSKPAVEGDEDDVIMESPKKAEQVLEDAKNQKRSEEEGNDCVYLTPPPNSEADLDETFVSSSIVRKCKLTDKHVLERIIGDQTPLKRPAREKSPEYDSVPFKYKREPVRKKAERMKLPGHACAECNKYYREVFGDEVSNQDLKRILNKCSRHRDDNSPTAEETPPGYWKPYLTCTEISPSKDDTVLR